MTHDNPRYDKDGNVSLSQSADGRMVIWVNDTLTVWDTAIERPAFVAPFPSAKAWLDGYDYAQHVSPTDSGEVS